MAPRNALANISFTVDSASEDDMTLDELNPMPTPDSNTENKAPARKARGKAAQPAKAASATEATAKSKPPTRVAETKKDTAAAKKAPAKAGRKALAERKKGGDDDAVEADELDEDETTEVAEPAKPAKRGRPAKAKKTQEEEPVEEEPVEEEPAPAPAKRGRKPAAKEPVAKKEPKAKSTAKARSSRRGEESEAEQDTLTIPETQAEPDVDPMDVDDSVEVEEIPESMPPPPRPSARPLARRPAAASRTRQPSAAGRRAGSASDTERDPALRRKVGDLTKKLEAMTAKYETLQDVATSGKESNFERLRRRTEQVSKDQDAVIKTLKQQVADLQTRTAEITSLNKTIAALTKTNSSLAAENKKLTDGLNTAQKENTTLNTKLAAVRSSTQPDAKVPGSAVKARTTGVVLPGSAEAAKDAMLQKQKVEMYCDLTNLVIVGVKKNEDDEDVYDCLQTGRNGTLHFHLTISEGGESYAETEFVYQPLLDEQRDKDLLDLLPDYLTEEISFPRAHAAKFFSKVVDSMSKRIVLEDEE